MMSVDRILVHPGSQLASPTRLVLHPEPTHFSAPLLLLGQFTSSRLGKLRKADFVVEVSRD